jgi:hypothetical protein
MPTHNILKFIWALGDNETSLSRFGERKIESESYGQQSGKTSQHFDDFGLHLSHYNDVEQRVLNNLSKVFLGWEWGKKNLNMFI